MRILGIEFGSWSLKAVEMESRFRRLDLLDFHEVRLPLQITDPTATYKAAVEKLMARLPSHPEKIVTSLPPSQTALRFLQIPIKQRKKVEKMFRFELEDNVPFKLDDAIIEHHVMKAPEGSLVLAAIAPKRHIQTHIEWLRSVGIDPDWLTFEGMGLVNIYLSQWNPKATDNPQGPILLMDIGHQKTNIAVFEQDRILLFRTIAWGGAAVTQAIAMALGVSAEEAERCKMNDLKLDKDLDGASADEREMITAAGQAFSSFLADVNHSLVSFRSQYGERMTAVRIAGGTSKIWGFDAFLERSLDMPVTTFKERGDINFKGDVAKVDEIRFGEPMGRALVFARKATLLFNFRKQEMGKETSLTEVSAFLKNPNVIRLLKYSAAFAVLMLIHVNIAGYLADQEAKAASNELKKAFSETFKDVSAKQRGALTSNPKDLKKFIDQKNNELDQKLKMLSKARLPMLSLVRGISESFPADVRVDVNKMQLDDRTFLMEGVLYEGDLSKVTDNLKKVTSLSKIDLSRDGQRFTYRGELVGR